MCDLNSQTHNLKHSYLAFKLQFVWSKLLKPRIFLRFSGKNMILKCIIFFPEKKICVLNVNMFGRTFVILNFKLCLRLLYNV